LNRDANGSLIRIDVTRLKQQEAQKLVVTKIWRTKEGQRVLITGDGDLSFLLSILAEHGFTYEKPREEDGVMTLRAVRK
jgi:uncharacterized protein (DUF2249 family)